MRIKQIVKHKHITPVPKKIEIHEEDVVVKQKNKDKKETDMNAEQIVRAEQAVEQINVPQNVKVVKKERGLIERTESSKIVLTEDNRQVLVD